MKLNTYYARCFSGTDHEYDAYDETFVGPVHDNFAKIVARNSVNAYKQLQRYLPPWARTAARKGVLTFGRVKSYWANT